MSQEIQTQPENAGMLPWKKALINAEHKFMAITDQKKAKIELGFAVQAIEANPVLKNCDIQSIQNAIINVARLGSTLNPAMKLCYLIPRKGKCVLDISYVGLIKILTDGGDVKYVAATIVYEDEEFSFDPINTKHTPKYATTEEENTKRKIHGALSTAILKDDTRVYEFIPRWELEKIERVSQSAGSAYSPYKDWRTEMYKKAVIKRHYKFLPKGNPDHERMAAIQEIESQSFAPSKPASVADMIDDVPTVEVPYEEIKATPTVIEEPLKAAPEVSKTEEAPKEDATKKDLFDAPAKATKK